MRFKFETFTGEVRINHNQCKRCQTHICVDICPVNIFKLDEKGLPTLSKGQSEVKKGGCIECLACEQECLFKGNGALEMLLPLSGYQ